MDTINRTNWIKLKKNWSEAYQDSSKAHVFICNVRLKGLGSNLWPVTEMQKRLAAHLWCLFKLFGKAVQCHLGIWFPCLIPADPARCCRFHWWCSLFIAASDWNCWNCFWLSWWHKHLLKNYYDLVNYFKQDGGPYGQEKLRFQHFLECSLTRPRTLTLDLRTSAPTKIGTSHGEL